MSRIEGRDPEVASAIMDGDHVRLYRKVAPVRAFPISEDAVIHTPEGEMVAHIGDYLVSDEPPTHLWPVKRDVFERTYEAAANPSPDGSLDAAWAEAEAALPEGWMFDVGSGESQYVADRYAARAAPVEFRWPVVLVKAGGATPAEALRNLARRLAASDSPEGPA